MTGKWRRETGSVSGYPAIVVPAGFSEPSDDAPIGVPIGMEMLGRPFTEPTLIEIASFPFGFGRGLSYHQFNVGHIESPAVKLLHKPQLPENL